MFKTAKRTVKLDQDRFAEIYATWTGGAYIDLHWYSADGPAFEVINVYDYRAGKIQDNVNVLNELQEWIKSINEVGSDEMANYFQHTA